jgi:two-component system, chemotaxis family, sensor kinase CheA
VSDGDVFDLDRQALLAVFLAEAEERLSQMEEALVALEERPGDEELVQAIFRAAHTLKGNAAALGFGALAELTHVLEDLLDEVRSRALSPSAALVTLLLESVDAMRELVADAGGGLDELRPPHRALLHRLARARAASLAGAPPAGPGRPRTDEVADERSAEVPGLNPVTRTLRVDVERLDRMLDLAGEIAVARGRLRDVLEREGATVASAVEVHREADRLEAELHELVTRIRMVPVGPTFQHFSRTVRDLARTLKKQARLTVDGGDIELDMSVLEKIRDPLTHMVRNAVDHGLELPDVRAAAGKDPCGSIRISASHDAGSIVVELSDDGAGLDRGALLERGRTLGLVGRQDSPADEEIDSLIFAPGISTAETVTELSGRGVGMDVVLREIEALRGTVDVASVPGAGTRFRLRLPLTLALIDGFVVRAADEAYVIPMDAVLECVDLPADAGRDGDAGLTGLMNLRGAPLPYLRLARLFRLADAKGARESVVVIRNESATAGFVVDSLVGGTQVVVKPLGALFRGIAGVAGSAILGNGRAALILDVPKLMKQVFPATAHAREA